MTKGPDDTTDKLFPPPETTDVFPPLPAGRSIREEFLVHRQGITLELKEFRADIVKLLAAHGGPKEPTAVKARSDATRAALKLGRYSGLALAGAEVAAEVAKIWWPGAVGPIGMLIQLFGGG